MSELIHIHGGDLAAACTRYGFDYDELLDCSANINPLGPPPAVLRALERNLGLIRHYPDPNCLELRAALAAYLNVSLDSLILGNGSSELIYHLVRVTGCRRALTLAPTFSEYGLAVLAAEGEVREVPLVPENGFALPVERVLEELNECDLVFLCNPNNPTGRLEKRGDLAKIITTARATGTIVVIDEAFMDFIPDREDYTLVRQAGQPGGPVVLYSLTKFFGIPGLRLGAVVAPPELAGRLENSRDPWSVNTMAQVAGLAALGEKAYMEETRAVVERERRFLEEELARFPGVAVFPGTANYLLLDIRGTGLDAGTLTEKMGQLGILVRDCSSFSGLGDGFIRVAVRLRFENRRLLAGLQSIMGGISK